MNKETFILFPLIVVNLYLLENIVFAIESGHPVFDISVE
jgi:hypothetical protein